MSLPRLAVLCAISELGGAEISLLELVATLRGRYEFHLIVPGEGGFRERAEAAGAKVWILPWPVALAATGETSARPGAARLLRAAISLKPFTRRVAAVLAQIQPAAFLTNAAKAHIVGALTPRPKGVPLIWYMRDGYKDRQLSRRTLAFLDKRCDLAICISRYVEAEVELHISRTLRRAVVYNIVDLEAFRPGNRPMADVPKDPADIWFGIIGAITPLKGIDIFLDAAQKVAERLPNSSFLIVGMNPYDTQAKSLYESQLRERIESSPLRDRVKLLGFRKDIPNVLASLDVLVQSNRGPEGLGRSVLEAMACGVSVIAVNRWGPAETIQDGITGLLFPYLDSAALADRMIALAKDPDSRASLGRAARLWIEENLAPQKLAGQFETVVAECIHSKAAGQVSL
jgi:glycosyltransferase involved in cell wall biosynthesis